MSKPYNDDAHLVNEEITGHEEPPPSVVMLAIEEQRRNILAKMDLITTEDVMFALRCSKKTLATYRSAGLKQLGEGRQQFYRLSQVAAVMEALAEPEKNDGKTQEGQR